MMARGGRGRMVDPDNREASKTCQYSRLSQWKNLILFRRSSVSTHARNGRAFKVSYKNSGRGVAVLFCYKHMLSLTAKNGMVGLAGIVSSVIKLIVTCRDTEFVGSGFVG